MATTKPTKIPIKSDPAEGSFRPRDMTILPIALPTERDYLVLSPLSVRVPTQIYAPIRPTFQALRLLSSCFLCFAG